MSFPMKNTWWSWQCLPIKNGAFPMKHGDVPIKMVNFPMKHDDFPVRYVAETTRPICSMYDKFIYIWVILRANVGIYSRHGAYGTIHWIGFFGKIFTRNDSSTVGFLPWFTLAVDPLVNEHNCGKSPFIMGQLNINCHFQ